MTLSQCIASAMFAAPVECCECAAPIGEEGALRGVLLFPCQHLLHSGCVEYITKRKKLQHLIARGEGSGGVGAMSSPSSHEVTGGAIVTCGESMSCSGPTTSSGSHSGGGNSSGSSRRLVVCPACMCPIQRLIPLFPSGGDAHSGTRISPAEGALQFKETHHAQKSNIAQLRALYQQREHVTQLTRTCALMHERLSEVQSEVDRLSTIIPAPALAAHVPELAGEDLRVEGMTVTELELYIVESSATLKSLERDVCEKRRQVEKRKKRLSNLRLQYQLIKESRSRGEETAKRDDEAGESADGEFTFHSLRRSKRLRSVPVVDLVEQESSAKAEAVVVSSGNASCDEAEENQPTREGTPERRSGHTTSANHNSSDGDINNINDDDDDVVLIDPTDAHATHRGSIGAGGVGANDTRNMNNHNSSSTSDVTATADSDDTLMRYMPLRRLVLMESTQMHAPNATRLLPRREDRLWQSSLEGML